MTVKEQLFQKLETLQRSNSDRKVEVMQTKLQEQLFPADAEVILERLPERIGWL